MIEFNLQHVAQGIDAKLIGSDVHFKGCSTDTRTIESGQLFLALHGPNFDGHDYLSIAAEKGAHAMIIDRECELPAGTSALQVENTRQALGDLANLWRKEFSQPVIGITGSNGKTTVKEMLKAILLQAGDVLATQGNLNNDIGVPLTLFNLADQDFAVIEMGANHMGEIAELGKIAEPNIGVVTLCAPAHLEGFGSVENVAKAKGEMFSSLDRSGTAVINADDHYADLWREMASHCQILTFGIDQEADVHARNLQLGSDQSEFDLIVSGQTIAITLPFAGRHNVMNALAAAACAHVAGISLDLIKAGLANTKGAPGRLQFKPVSESVTLIDDTYNANPRSLSAGIDVLINTPGRHWLVLGDMGELGEDAEKFHRDLAEQARSKGVERLYCVGELCLHAANAFGAGAMHFDQQKELIEQLERDLQGDITLLIKGSRSAHMETVVNALTRST